MVRTTWEASKVCTLHGKTTRSARSADWIEEILVVDLKRHRLENVYCGLRQRHIMRPTILGSRGWQRYQACVPIDFFVPQVRYFVPTLTRKHE